jgi:hypothetical protein
MFLYFFVVVGFLCTNMHQPASVLQTDWVPSSKFNHQFFSSNILAAGIRRMVHEIVDEPHPSPRQEGWHVSLPWNFCNDFIFVGLL